jgi:pimeloyl-ACP methyl ester carboxylesterase
VREEAVSIDGLFGIVSEPASSDSLSNTAILLLNIGANHHIGSNRMYVDMAREYASLGFRVLRLDFSGVGDSPARSGAKENDIYTPRAFGEARRAIDFLQARGSTRFVLMGLCSGAYVAYHTAVSDPRVSGVVLINTAVFHWKEGDKLEIVQRGSLRGTRYYQQALWRPETWVRLARGDLHVAAITRALAKRVESRVVREANALWARLQGEDAEVSDVHRGFRTLLARGTQCFLVFGNYEAGIDLIEEHLGRNARALRGARGFRMEIVEGVDHTFTPLHGQKRLRELVADHLVATYLNAEPTGTSGQP